MDVAKMSTEDLQALKAALSGSVMSPDVVPLEGDRSKVPEMLVGRLPLRNAVDLTAARMFKNDDDEAAATRCRGEAAATGRRGHEPRCLCVVDVGVGSVRA